VTRTIGGIEEGRRVYLDATHGAFTLAGHEAEGIGLIAGGVGIAPILSLLRHLRAARDPRPVRLLYGAASYDHLIASDEIEAMRTELNLEVEIVLAKAPSVRAGRTGVLDAGVIRNWLTREQPERWLYFMCGPIPMMQEVEHTLHVVPSNVSVSPVAGTVVVRSTSARSSSASGAACCVPMSSATSSKA
jgi:NAD(P)H-flavin reductase